MAGSGSNVTQSTETQVEATESQLLLERRFIGRLTKGTPTPSVENVEHWVAVNTAAQNITNFLKGQPGQHLYILGEGFTTIVHAPGVIENFGSANKLLTDGKVAHYLMYDDGVWYEESSEGAQGPPGPSLPEAANATERDTLYPTPSVGFKVLMLDSDTLVRWNGTIWETTLEGEPGVPGPPGALRGVVYAADTLDKTGATDIALGLDAILTGDTGPVEILFEEGIYKLATARTTGTRVKLTFQPGAMIRVDGVIFRHLGTIDAELTQIFDCVNNGRVELFDIDPANSDSSWGKPSAFVPEIWTEWFGAKGDNVVVDDFAWDRTWDALRGGPHTPLGIPSWCRGELRMRAGGMYKKERGFRPLASVGFAMRGGGSENTQIIFHDVHSRKTMTFTATPTAAANEVQLTLNGATSFPSTLVDRFIIVAGPDSIGLPREIIADLGGGLVRLDKAHNWGVNPQIAYIIQTCIIDLSGTTDPRLEEFTILTEGSFKEDTRLMAGIYYHRDSRVTLRGSSRGRFKNVMVYGNYHVAGFAIGSFHEGSVIFQEDLATFWNCHALSQWYNLDTDIERRLWCQNGFRFGTGVFANPLNYTCDGCVSAGWSNGVAVYSTNIIWTGGTIQSNNTDIYALNGGHSYISFGGFRTEGSGRLFYGWSGQAMAFAINLHDIEVACENMRPSNDSGKYDLITLPWSGVISLRNIRGTNTPGTDKDTAGTNPRGTNVANENTIITSWGEDVNGNSWFECANKLDPWVAGEFDGEYAVVAKTGTFSHIYKVLNNTANRITLVGTLLEGTPDGVGFDRTEYTLDGTMFGYARHTAKVRYSHTQPCSINLQGVQLIYYDRESCFVSTNAGAAEWHFEGCTPLKPDGSPYHTAREGVAHYGRVTDIAHDFGFSSGSPSGYPAAWWTMFAYGRVVLNSATYEIPLGGVPFLSGPVVPQVPFPRAGSRHVFEVTQDATGSRQLTFACTKPIKWDGGVAPSDTWAANKIRRYEAFYTGKEWLMKLLGEW